MKAARSATRSASHRPGTQLSPRKGAQLFTGAMPSNNTVWGAGLTGISMDCHSKNGLINAVIAIATSANASRRS